MAQTSPPLLRFPDHLPLLGGLVAAALVAGWGITQTSAEITFGRPSSTAGLGFVVAPVVGVIAGIAVYALAVVVLRLLHRAGVRPAATVLPRLTLPVLVLILIAALGQMFLHGRAIVLAREIARAPRVLVSTTALTPLDDGTALEARVAAPLLYILTSGDTPVAPLRWNGRDIVVDIANESVFVKDAAGATLASTDLHAFDYIRRVSAVPVCPRPDGRTWLAVLITLRATSDRSMLVVFDVDGHTLYQEHLARTSGPDDALFAGTTGGVPAFGVDAGTPRAWRCEPPR